VLTQLLTKLPLLLSPGHIHLVQPSEDPFAVQWQLWKEVYTWWVTLELLGKTSTSYSMSMIPSFLHMEWWQGKKWRMRILFLLSCHSFSFPFPFLFLFFFSLFFPFPFLSLKFQGTGKKISLRFDNAEIIIWENISVGFSGNLAYYAKQRHSFSLPPSSHTSNNFF